MRLLWKMFIITILVYLLAFASVFNVFRAAQPYDVESDEAACGPRPKWLFCKPHYGGMFYDGHEWPFVVFRPLCKVWIRLVGCHDYLR